MKQYVKAVLATEIFKHKETFVINQTYRRIWDITKDFNAHILPRRGFGFLDSSPHKKENAVWCINLDEASIWKDVLTDNGNTLLVKKVSDATPSDLQKRIWSSKDGRFDVSVRRLTFARTKKNGEYRCLGVFMLSAIDFDNQRMVFKKVEGNVITITKQKAKVYMCVEKEEDTVSF